jgi:hypothetical protein
VVSWGPWKGDLYNADWIGTGTDELNDGVLVAGLVVFFAGLAGGGIRRWTRLEEPRHPGPAPVTGGEAAEDADQVAGAGPADPPTLFTYGILAAEADRQSIHPPGPRRRPPDRDIREVPWWQVWSLLRLSSLSSALSSFVAGGVLAVLALTSSDIAPWGTFVIVALWVVGGLRAPYEFARGGLSGVRVLARAARAPVPVPKRYVLLRETHGGNPVLLFFSPYGGDEELPEATLTLVPTGTSKKPWFGLPAPSGECELRGWLDSAPTVVPWIEGRPLWPKEPYAELQLGRYTTRLRLERLTPGVIPEPPPA